MHTDKLRGARLALVAVLVMLAAGGTVIGFAEAQPEWFVNIMWFLRANLFWLVPAAGLVIACALVSRVVKRRRAPWAVAGVLLGAWIIVHAMVSPQQSVSLTTADVLRAESGRGFTAFFDREKFEGGSTYRFSGTEYPYATLLRQRGERSYTKVMEKGHVKGASWRRQECIFSERARASFDGRGSEDLAALVYERVRGLKIDMDGTHARCSSDGRMAPQIVMPLVEQDGVIFVTEKPTATAVYDGITGKVTIYGSVPDVSVHVPNELPYDREG